MGDERPDLVARAAAGDVVVPGAEAEAQSFYERREKRRMGDCEQGGDVTGSESRLYAGYVNPNGSARFGSYEVRLNLHADEDDRGGHVAWEVWNWRIGAVESDWFTAPDAHVECLRLADEES